MKHGNFQSRLDSGKVSWHRYRLERGVEKRLTIQKINFSYRPYIKFDLHNCDFEGCNYKKAEFDGSNFKGATFKIVSSRILILMALVFQALNSLGKRLSAGEFGAVVA